MNCLMQNSTIRVCGSVPENWVQRSRQQQEDFTMDRRPLGGWLAEQAGSERDGVERNKARAPTSSWRSARNNLRFEVQSRTQISPTRQFRKSGDPCCLIQEPAERF